MLSNKVVVITGAAGLIGKTFSHAVIDADGIVVLAEFNETAGKALESELNAKRSNSALFVATDITSASSLQALIETVHNRFGKIDALVNNAYPRNKNYGRAFEEVTYKDFSENMSMHVGGYFLAAQQFVSYFSRQGYGNIINMASIYGVVAPRFDIYENAGFTMPVEYAVIKSGIIHLSKYISRYTKGKNIRCNVISPGGIFNNHDKTFVDQYSFYANNKGMLDPKDLNGTLVFLLSDAS
ncbi:MAG: flagellin modification protein PtmA [Bacteroidia bacterium]